MSCSEGLVVVIGTVPLILIYSRCSVGRPVRDFYNVSIFYSVVLLMKASILMVSGSDLLAEKG